MKSATDAASAASTSAAAPSAPPTDAPSAPPTPPTPSLATTWGNVSFGAPPRSVRVREMMIPDVIATAARALVDALDAARGDRIVTIDIGAGDRAWPKDVPRSVENCEFLRLAIRKEIERRGHRITSGTPADGVWQVSVIYGRDTVGWRMRVIAPRRRT